MAIRDLANHLRRSSRARLAAKIVGTLLALGLATLSLRGVPLSGLLARLGAFPRWALGLAVAASLSQVALLAARLWLMFPPGERPGFLTVARAYSFGQLGNGVLPGRSGDFMKVVALSRGDALDARGRRPSVGGATTVVLADKALDLITFAGLAAVAGGGLLVGALSGAWHAAWAIALAAVVAVLGALLFRRLRPGAFARAGSSLRRAATTARRALSPGRATMGVVLGVGGWLAELAVMVALGAGLGLHLSVLQILRGLVVLNLGITVPVSVANVGTYEAATVAGLAPAGVPAADAVALGALHHAVQLGAAFLAAAIFWARDRLALRTARAAEAPAALLLAAPEA
jgi:uncharacterized membrane protein YbhN (UPF0104 family)